jgi:hypothetical protein
MGRIAVDIGVEGTAEMIGRQQVRPVVPDNGGSGADGSPGSIAGWAARSTAWRGGADASRRWCRRRRGPGGTGGHAQPRRVGAHERSRRERRPKHRRVTRVRAWRSTPRSPRPARPPRCAAARGHDADPPAEDRLPAGDLGPPRGEELADFDTVVHVTDTTTAPRRLGCSLSTPIISDFLTRCAAGCLEP